MKWGTYWNHLAICGALPLTLLGNNFQQTSLPVVGPLGSANHSDGSPLATFSTQRLCHQRSTWLTNLQLFVVVTNLQPPPRQPLSGIFFFSFTLWFADYKSLTSCSKVTPVSHHLKNGSENNTSGENITVVVCSWMFGGFYPGKMARGIVDIAIFLQYLQCRYCRKMSRGIATSLSLVSNARSSNLRFSGWMHFPTEALYVALVVSSADL